MKFTVYNSSSLGWRTHKSSYRLYQSASAFSPPQPIPLTLQLSTHNQHGALGCLSLWASLSESRALIFHQRSKGKVRRRGRVHGGGGSCQFRLTQARMKILGGQETSSDTPSRSPLPPVPGHPPFSPINCIVQPEKFSAGQTLWLYEAPWFLPQMLTSSRSSSQKWKMEYCAI